MNIAIALRRLGRPAPADNHARGRVRRVSLCTPLISNTSLLSEPTSPHKNDVKMSPNHHRI